MKWIVITFLFLGCVGNSSWQDESARMEKAYLAGDISEAEYDAWQRDFANRFRNLQHLEKMTDASDQDMFQGLDRLDYKTN